MIGTKHILALFMMLSLGYTSGLSVINDKSIIECIEGSYWTVDCNICECYEGQVICTTKKCLSNPVPMCKEGDRWYEETPEGCTTSCTCSNGFTTCTEEMCPMEEECIEGSYVTVDCNICDCDAEQVVCTTKNCLSNPVPTCMEGSRWYETSPGNCNTTCICSNGVTTCTEEICLPDEAEDCYEGSTWMIDCNRCTCFDGLGSCSNNTCAPNTECDVEGATWNDGCNFCYCFDGQATCSDNTCLLNIERSTLIELSKSTVIDTGRFKLGDFQVQSGPGNLLTEDGIWKPIHKPWFVIFDFKEIYTVNNVTIINTGDSIHDVISFGIESSNDGQEWTLVEVISKVAPGDDQPQYFSISGKGRYWKLTIVEIVSQYQPWVVFFGFFGYESTDDKLECLEGTRWTEQCNICTCQSGYAACTHRTCLPECIEGSYFVKDCNICECHEGQITCSTKNSECLSDQGPKCKEGSRWIETSPDWCSTTCICSNGVTTCTEEICPHKEAEDSIRSGGATIGTCSDYRASSKCYRYYHDDIRKYCLSGERWSQSNCKCISDSSCQHSCLKHTDSSKCYIYYFYGSLKYCPGGTRWSQPNCKCISSSRCQHPVPDDGGELPMDYDFPMDYGFPQLMSGVLLAPQTELESCRNRVNGEQPLLYKKCLNCPSQLCQACDDCANISKCHIFNARTCKCHKKFRCKV